MATVEMAEFFGAKGSGDYKREPNTLFSTDMVEVLLGISEGPIKGLVDGAKSFYLDSTPLQGPDGKLTVEDARLVTYLGNELGETIASLQNGFGSVINVGTSLAHNTPVVRSGTKGKIDFIDLRFQVNALVHVTEKGEFGWEGKLKIEMRKSSSNTWVPVTVYSEQTADLYVDNTLDVPKVSAVAADVAGIPNAVWVDGDTAKRQDASGGWVASPDISVVVSATPPQWSFRYSKKLTIWKRPNNTFSIYNGSTWINPGSTKPQVDTTAGVITVKGKTTAGVVKEYRIPVENLEGVTYDFRVTKLTETVDDGGVQKVFDVVWSSIDEVTAQTFNWPGLAVTQFTARASDQFSSLPELTGIYEGRIIRVPSNYNPVTRIYSGVWDGTWKMAYSNNPALIGYDLVMNNRYGVNAYYPVDLNKWDVYEAAQWCDVITADGTPRFTFNGLIQNSTQGRDAINYIFGIMGARFFDDGNGQAVLRLDRNDAPVAVFGNSNVADGQFVYTFTPLSKMYNDITVSFLNEEADYKQDRRRVTDDNHIAKYGRIPYKFEAIGCTSTQEGIRRARYQLATSISETTSVSFKTNRQASFVEPYDIILIADENVDFGIEGRIRTRETARRLALRDPITLESGFTYEATFMLAGEGGTYQAYRVGIPSSHVGVTITEISFGVDLPAGVTADTVFAITQVGTNFAPKPFRVISISPDSDDGDSVTVQAIEVNRAKWSYIDGHVDDIPTDISGDPALAAPKAVGSFTAEAKFLNGVRVAVLTWTKSPSPNVKHYELNYSRNGDPFITLGLVKGNTFTFSPFSDGDYLFGITPRNQFGVYGTTRYARIDATIDTNSLPLLQGVTVSARTQVAPDGTVVMYLDMSWDPIGLPNAEYRVGYEQGAGTTPKTTFQTPSLPNGDYTVSISAWVGDQQVSQTWMDTVTVRGKETLPPAPTGWVGEPGFRQITLSGPRSNLPDFKEFRIYTSTDSSGPWTYFGAIAGTNFVRQVTGSASDHFYTITQVNRSDKESGKSPAINVVPISNIIFDELDASVKEKLEDLEDWMDGYPAEVETAIQQARADMASTRQEFVGALQVVEQDVADAEQLALDNLNLAKDYTDTSVEAEQVARVTEQEALAAQIQTLTAVLNSENYLQNPRFTEGTAGWTVITGPLTIVERDEGSPDPIIATAPTPKFAMRSIPGTSAHALEQTFDVEMDPGEVIQWRLFLTASAVIPVQVRLYWFDEDDTQIGAAIDKSITIVPNEWRVFSGRVPPPEGAVRLCWNILRGSTTSTTGETAQLCVADASVTKVDVSVLARIIDLEVVVANNEGATTLWQSNAESRFGDAEDELDAVAIAMSNRYTKAEADAATAMSSNQLSASFSNALARSPVGLVGKADPVLRPYGASSAGTVEAYGTIPASAYGEDADGPYVTRATSTGANGVYLRATTPSHDDAVYRVTYRVKPLANLDFRLRCSWLAVDGSSISGTSMATRSWLAADGLQEISVVVGCYSGGLVDVAVGGANWANAHMLRFGIDNWPATAGEAYRVYEIRVDDLSGEDAAARNIANVQASVTSEQIARASADTALAGRATSLETRMGTAETRITNETVARSNADTALAGRTTALETTTGLHNARIGNTELAISNQTSALAAFDQRVEAQSLGQNLVLDGVFAEGLAKWPRGTIPLSLYERNLASSTWQYRLLPGPRAWRVTPADIGKYRGTGLFPVMRGEEIRVSFDVARWSVNCVGLRTVLRFFDAGGTQLPSGSGLTITVGAVANRYQSLAASKMVPDTAVSAEVYFQVFESSGTNTGNAFITNLKALRGQEAYASGALQISSEAATGGGALTRIGLLARAKDVSAGKAALYLEADGNGDSTAILQADATYITDSDGERALFAVVGGEVYIGTRMSAANLDVDALLTLGPQAGLMHGKTSPDDSADGIYFGRAGSGFGFSTSRTGANDRIQEVNLSNEGFRITNADFYRRAGKPDTAVRRTTGGTISLAGKTMVRIASAIGGGAGGAASNSGGAGGNTIVRLYDGGTLKQTITANGGSGTFGLHGVGQPGQDPGNRGGGGNGAKYINEAGRSVRGQGGRRGATTSAGWVDISGWASPSMQVTIGAGGAPNTSGTIINPGSAGIAGAVTYQTMTTADQPAGVVPLAPTAYGTITKSGLSVTFPNLGPGLWVLSAPDDQNLDIGSVEVAPGRELFIRTSQVTFMASKRPVRVSGGWSKNMTISYLFYAMGG